MAIPGLLNGAIWPFTFCLWLFVRSYGPDGYEQKNVVKEADTLDRALPSPPLRSVAVDARSSEAYDREPIPSAISIQHCMISQEPTARLDEAARYATHCDGIGCLVSTKGGLKMAKLG